MCKTQVLLTKSHFGSRNKLLDQKKFSKHTKKSRFGSRKTFLDQESFFENIITKSHLGPEKFFSKHINKKSF